MGCMLLCSGDDCGDVELISRFGLGKDCGRIKSNSKFSMRTLTAEGIMLQKDSKNSGSVSSGLRMMGQKMAAKLKLFIRFSLACL